MLAALVLLVLGGSRAWPLVLDVGGRDARFVGGFHETEHFGSMDVRWTTEDAELALPRPPGDGPAILTLRLLNSRPADQPDPQVALSADGRDLGQLTVIRKLDAARHYRVLIPGGAGLGWATRFRLQMAPFSLPNDPRPLGVVVDRAVLEPLGPAWPPSLWLALCALALGLTAYALPRMLGASPLLALALAAGLAGLLAAGVAARPLEVLPFLQRIPALLGLGCLGLALARRLTRTLAPEPADRAAQNGRGPSAAAPGSVGAEALPVYLAVAWWLGPLFQLVMTADGAVNVWPGIPTMWIGAGLAAALLLTQLPPLGARLSARGTRFSVVLALLAVAALLHLGYMIEFAFTRSGPDFWILFKGAREWARGGSLYDLQAIQTDHFGHVFKVPPFYGMLFVPFVFQDGLQILLFHRILNTVLLGLTGLVWLRMWGLRPASALGAGLLILLNCRPFADTIAFGQIDLVLLLLLSLALWALRGERDLLAGALIALGTLFKIYPVLLLAFLVAKRQWRALGGFALGMLLYNGLAVAVMGWEMHRIYLFEVLPKIGGTTSWVENQTVSGFLARLVSPPTVADIFANRSLALLGTALSGALGLLGCALALPEAPRRSTAYALQYGAFLLLMVLVVPAAWMHYETLLLVPFAALLLHAREHPLRLPRAAGLALGFALVAYGNQWSYYDGTVMGLLTVAGVSYKFYGMLLLGAVLVATLLETAPLRLPQLARLALRPSGR
jgi:hypothetical protein